MRSELQGTGVDAEIEPFDGYSTFGLPYGLILGAALAAAALPRRRRALRALLGATAAAGLVTEGELRNTPLSDALSRRRSQNVVAAIQPRGAVERTLCIVCHLDSSRSGLLFHPSFVRLLGRWITIQSLSVLVQGAAPILERSRPGRAGLAAARLVIAAGLGLIAERELRGVDVPGASDNASGCAVAAQLATETAANPLESTRLVLLMTGCEESGLIGMQTFLRSRDTKGWLFLNFDNVGGPATLRYLRREGVFRMWDADPGLVSVAASIAVRRRELGLAHTDSPAGLTYDATAVLARGGRALTLSAQDETIPNLHQPTDVPENVDVELIGRVLETGREMIAAIDRGEADRA
jgi:Peptidase family M28